MYPTLWTSYVTPAAAALPAGVHVPRHPAPPRLHERLRAAPPRANTIHHRNTHQGRDSIRLEIYFNANLHRSQKPGCGFHATSGLYLSTHQYMYRPHNTGQFPLVEQFINICCLWLGFKWCFKPNDVFELCPRFLEVKRNVALPEDVWLVDLDEAKIFPPEICSEVRNQHHKCILSLCTAD